MRRTNIYLDDEQCEALDRVAAEEEVSRAEVIRRLIDQGLGGSSHGLADDLDAIEASFGALADVEPIERGPDERSSHMDRMWHLRT